ncbi:hypothetical protein [Novacetimonas hansenii]|uniref:hypothetical protein n=1 Tax=Novacetimonas hansenii TaxID=436 RepID=UPI00094FAF8F|nr:hypothetical protein [Novacetimonas hansenii]
MKTANLTHERLDAADKGNSRRLPDVPENNGWPGELGKPEKSHVDGRHWVAAIRGDRVGAPFPIAWSAQAGWGGFDYTPAEFGARYIYHGAVLTPSQVRALVYEVRHAAYAAGRASLAQTSKGDVADAMQWRRVSVLMPAEDWFEDEGDVLWHRPDEHGKLCEAPIVGHPLSSDWDDDDMAPYTLWSRIPNIVQKP